MSSDGIMAEISTLLYQGKASGEIIGVGYKPSTVYKVQRKIRQQGQPKGRVSAQERTRPPAADVDNNLQSALEAENTRLRQEVKALEDQLESVVDEDANLQAEVHSLRERVKVLEDEAVTAGQLRQWVKDLRSQLERATHTLAVMRQRAAQWQQKFEVEQAARQKAEHKYDGALVILP